MKRNKVMQLSNVKLTKIENLDRARPEGVNYRKRVFEQQIYRVKQDIGKWRSALQAAEQILTPNRYLLYQTYMDVVLDNHLSALIQSRKNKTLSRKIKFVDESGNENEDIVKIFKSAWFRRFSDLALDSIFYGYSLIQFGQVIGDKFQYVELVPRQYVKPEFGVVVENYSLNTGVSYLTPPFSRWTIGVGEKRDLGLLLKACPPAIYKKNALAAWSEMAEIFGMPLRVGKTNVRDEQTRKNMEDMFRNMGTATSGVFDTDDIVEFIETGKNDPFQVYNQLIERANSEISKLIMGQTMTTDNGSSRSQAEVHETVSNEVGESDAFFMQYVYNDQLLPMMRDLGFPIPEGGLEWDTTESLAIADQFNIDIQLINSGKFKVDPKYITETYGTPVEETEDPQPDKGVEKKKSKSLMNTISDLYRGKVGHICNEKDDKKLIPNLFTEQDKTDLISLIYAGTVTTLFLDTNIYKKTAATLIEGVEKGYGKDMFTVVFGTPDYEMLKELKKNIYVFSGAKTYQQTKDISSKLMKGGKKVSFSEFKKEADLIFDEYNKNYLKTEYITATAQARMASKWMDIERDKELFPYLKYKTVGDARVRQDHAALDGVTKRVEDEFWKTYYPPNGWHCRCTVGQEEHLAEISNSAEMLNYSIEDVTPEFRFNSGIEKKIFSNKHPYFNVGSKIKPFAKRNFDLPIYGQ